MDIEVFQIDLVGVDYDATDVYAAAAPFLRGCNLAKIEQDGDILAKEQINIIAPEAADSFFKDYKVDGSRLETLVASERSFDQEEWHLDGTLPCILTNANAAQLRSLMRRNHWDHYLCLAQTQMLIGTTNTRLSKAFEENRALEVEFEPQANP